MENVNKNGQQTEGNFQNFLNEDIKFKSKTKLMFKSFFKSALYILVAFLIGIASSFAYTFTKELLLPKLVRNSVITSNTEANSENIEFQSNTNTLNQIIEKVRPSVVTITALSENNTIFNIPVEKEEPGSGIIFYKTATEIYIVTNYHVIQNAYKVGVAIQEKEPVLATLVGKDVNSDLAVLCVNFKDLQKQGISDVTVAQFANSDNVLTGDYVIAIGNTLGEGNTATFGIVSAISKDITLNNTKLNVIQTSAAINQGNGGGALVNLNGDVIGINTTKVSNKNVEGIGYSISSNKAIGVVEQIMNNTNPPTLGIYIADASSNQNSKYKMGALIVEVIKGGAAEKANLQPNDIITGIDGTPVLNAKQLSELIRNYKPKETVKLSVIRNNEVKIIRVKLLEQTNSLTSF